MTARGLVGRRDCPPGRLTERLRILCFFFSSRRRHTRLQGDWSSDVCSSDLTTDAQIVHPVALGPLTPADASTLIAGVGGAERDRLYEESGGNPFYLLQLALMRSEERRVGKECRSRWSPYH